MVGRAARRAASFGSRLGTAGESIQWRAERTAHLGASSMKVRWPRSPRRFDFLARSDQSFRMNSPTRPAPPSVANLRSGGSRHGGATRVEDAYRGLVMFLLMAEVLAQAKSRRPFRTAGSEILSGHQSHVNWVGARCTDLIQPPRSRRSCAFRSRARGVGIATWMAWHAIGPGADALVLLGVFLRSTSRNLTNGRLRTPPLAGYYSLRACFKNGCATADQALPRSSRVLGGVCAVSTPGGLRLHAGRRPKTGAAHGHTGLRAHWQRQQFTGR